METENNAAEIKPEPKRRNRALHRLKSGALKSLPAGTHLDGGGLRLLVTAPGRGSWILRYTCRGRNREAGLGPFPTVSLSDAREKAAAVRRDVLRGKDPLEAKRRLKADAATRRLQAVTDAAWKAHAAALKDAAGWQTPLRPVLAKLGKLDICDITQTDIVAALKETWAEKPETARKALNRLNVIYRYAAAGGIDVDITVPQKARLLLGQRAAETVSIPAMDHAAVPAYYARLVEMPDTSVVLALRLLILTGVRSGSLREARVGDFDIERRVWNIPGRYMKDGADFAVPLSDEAIAVVQAAMPFRTGSGVLFGNVSGRGPLTDRMLSAAMTAHGEAARPHGFRASLRTWLAEVVRAPHAVAEYTLAHRPKNAVVDAYRRTQFLDERRELLDAWASHVTGRKAEVIRLRAAR